MTNLHLMWLVIIQVQRSLCPVFMEKFTSLLIYPFNYLMCMSFSYLFIYLFIYLLVYYFMPFQWK